MANKQRGESSILLDKERVLKYDLNALAEIEDHLGVPLTEMGNVKMTIKNVRVILWAGLIHEDEEITQKQVGSLVDMDNFSEVQERLKEAFKMKDTGKNE